MRIDSNLVIQSAGLLGSSPLVSNTGNSSNISLNSVSPYANANDDVNDISAGNSLRSRIRALSMSTKSAEEGVSEMQTADTALIELERMIGRMKELSTQASGSNLTEDDRSILQNEIGYLNSEIDRVSQNTSFGGRPLLSGSTSVAPLPSFHYTQTRQTRAVAAMSADSATGLSVSVSFITASAGDTQNALATSFLRDGINISKNIKQDAITGERIVTYGLSLATSVASGYNVSADNSTTGVFSIKDTSGELIARMTVSGGQETLEVVTADSPVERRNVFMTAANVAMAEVGVYQAQKPATAVFNVDSASGLSVNISFATAAAGDIQNALARNLRDNGITVGKDLRAIAGGSGVASSYSFSLASSVSSAYRVQTLDIQTGSFAINAADGTRLANVTVSGGTNELSGHLVIPQNTMESARLTAVSVTGGRAGTAGALYAARAEFSANDFTAAKGISGIQISFVTSAAGALQNNLALSLQEKGLNISRITDFSAGLTTPAVSYNVGLNFLGYNVSAVSAAAGSFNIKDTSGNL
nr:flagellin [Lachnospiraceae bacterium]